MADEDVVSTGSEAGDIGNTSGEKDSGKTSQEAGQSQSLESGSVDPSTSQTSSAKGKGRENFSWANQRLIEKAIDKRLQSALQTHLSPFIEELRASRTPPAVSSSNGQEQPDYNDLSGWINKRVESLLQTRLEQELKPKLSSFESKLTGQYAATAKKQEARNYLLSQKDIGRDDEKIGEIGQILKDNLLDYAFQEEPLQAIQLAVDIWRKQRTNPNAPLKSHLSTVSGGTGTTQKGEPGLNEILALQNKLISGQIPMDEKEKLSKEIDALVFRK